MSHLNSHFLLPLLLVSMTFLASCGSDSGDSDDSSNSVTTNTNDVSDTALQDETYLPGEIRRSIDVTDAPIGGSPAIDSTGVIYTFTGNAYGVAGHLIAINADGSIQWEKDLGANWVGSFSSPSIGPDGTVYIGSSGELIAINPDGSDKWSFPISGYSSTPAVHSNGTIYITESDGFITAVNSNGTLQWQDSITGKGITAGFTTQQGPTIGPNGIYYSLDGGIIAAYDYNGNQLWTRAFAADNPTSPVVSPDGGEIYVAYEDGGIVALDNSGNTIWTNIIGSGGHGSSFVMTSDNNLIKTQDETVYAVSSVDGSVIWSYDVNDTVWSTPVLGDNGNIYFIDNGYTVTALSHNGVRQWFVNLYSGFAFANRGPGIIDENGNLFYVTGLGYLYSIATGSTGPQSGWPMFMKNAQNTGDDSL